VQWAPHTRRRGQQRRGHHLHGDHRLAEVRGQSHRIKQTAVHSGASETMADSDLALVQPVTQELDLTPGPQV